MLACSLSKEHIKGLNMPGIVTDLYLGKQNLPAKKGLDLKNPK